MMIGRTRPIAPPKSTLGMSSRPPARPSKGKLIAGMGIPGCGKSSVFKELGRICNVKVFLEPEEKYWPQAVYSRRVSGYFTAITWFRAARLPLLFEAGSLRDDGETVLIDTYYDKLVSSYLGKKGMEWLFHPRDPYYHLAQELSALDRKLLPEADCVVVFHVEKRDWAKFLKIRARRFDNTEQLAATYATQKYFVNASKDYCKSTESIFVLFEQEYSSPRAAAMKLRNELCSMGIQI